MLAARPHLEPTRKPGLNTLRVNEIYISLQGESTHQGLLCTFVRLTGCHLRCSYCDSEHSFYQGSKLTVGEVVERVVALGAPRVEVTGGEPLLQPAVYPLMEALLAKGLTVMLETSGSIDVREVPPAVQKIVDLKTPSSGESDRNDLRVLESMNANDELKFVIGSRADYDWAKGMIEAHRLAKRPYPLLFSAVHGRLSAQHLAEWIIADRLPVRFQLQQHKYVWKPEARGV
ncbi:MAG: Queuosine Biosynthesis QueE Radical [Myxococcaceae bacterium]|nr:Queuosine Biosynthesis QueE Radical [Myxococcaceae bacterium]